MNLYCKYDKYQINLNNIFIFIFTLIYLLSITIIPITKTLKNNFLNSHKSIFIKNKLTVSKKNFAVSYIRNSGGLSRQINNNIEKYLTNASGTVLKLINADTKNSGIIYQYDAYGKILTTLQKNSATAPNAFFYNGERTDNHTNLQYLQARFYYPNLKLFINQDSYDLLNKTNYADNNPIANSDPSGHISANRIMLITALLTATLFTVSDTWIESLAGVFEANGARNIVKTIFALGNGTPNAIFSADEISRGDYAHGIGDILLSISNVISSPSMQAEVMCGEAKAFKVGFKPILKSAKETQKTKILSAKSQEELLEANKKELFSTLFTSLSDSDKTSKINTLLHSTYKDKTLGDLKTSMDKYANQSSICSNILVGAGIAMQSPYFSFSSIYLFPMIGSGMFFGASCGSVYGSLAKLFSGADNIMLAVFCGSLRTGISSVCITAPWFIMDRFSGKNINIKDTALSYGVPFVMGGFSGYTQSLLSFATGQTPRFTANIARTLYMNMKGPIYKAVVTCGFDNFFS